MALAAAALGVALVGLAIDPGIPLPGQDLRLGVPGVRWLATAAAGGGLVLLGLALIDALRFRERRGMTVVLVLAACAAMAFIQLLSFVGGPLSRIC